MKKLFIILFILFLSSYVFAFNPMVVCSGVPVASGGSAQETILPDGDYSSSWTACSATPCADALNDDSDATYASMQDADDYETAIYTLADTSASSGKTINSVTVYGRSACIAGTCTDDLRLRLRQTTSGTYSDDSYFTPPGSPADTAGWELVDNPWTASAWSSAEIDQMAIAFNTATISSGQEQRMYEVWIVVDYVP